MVKFAFSEWFWLLKICVIMWTWRYFLTDHDKCHHWEFKYAVRVQILLIFVLPIINFLTKSFVNGLMKDFPKKLINCVATNSHFPISFFRGTWKALFIIKSLELFKKLKAQITANFEETHIELIKYVCYSQSAQMQLCIDHEGKALASKRVRSRSLIFPTIK